MSAVNASVALSTQTALKAADAHTKQSAAGEATATAASTTATAAAVATDTLKNAGQEASAKAQEATYGTQDENRIQVANIRKLFPIATLDSLVFPEKTDELSWVQNIVGGVKIVVQPANHLSIEWKVYSANNNHFVRVPFMETRVANKAVPWNQIKLPVAMCEKLPKKLTVSREIELQRWNDRLKEQSKMIALIESLAKDMATLEKLKAETFAEYLKEDDSEKKMGLEIKVLGYQNQIKALAQKHCTTTNQFLALSAAHSKFSSTLLAKDNLDSTEEPIKNLAQCAFKASGFFAIDGIEPSIMSSESTVITTFLPQKPQDKSAQFAPHFKLESCVAMLGLLIIWTKDHWRIQRCQIPAHSSDYTPIRGWAVTPIDKIFYDTLKKAGITANTAFPDGMNVAFLVDVDKLDRPTSTCDKCKDLTLEQFQAKFADLGLVEGGQDEAQKPFHADSRLVKSYLFNFQTMVVSDTASAAGAATSSSSGSAAAEIPVDHVTNEEAAIIAKAIAQAKVDELNQLVNS